MTHPYSFRTWDLIKPPHIGREKPWHQDCAYFNYPVGTTVVGVWIAIDAATEENGCLHIIPGSHREGPTPHFRRRDWQICDTEVAVPKNVTVPFDPGGCLFWHGMTHHGSPTNRSTHRRRALQYHYRPESTVEMTAKERLVHLRRRRTWGNVLNHLSIDSRLKINCSHPILFS